MRIINLFSKYGTIVVLLFCVICIISCSSIQDDDDYKNSLSTKQFLFDGNYSLLIDGSEVTKYHVSYRLHNEAIVELVQHGKIVSGMILSGTGKWFKFPKADIYAKLFSGG